MTIYCLLTKQHFFCKLEIDVEYLYLEKVKTNEPETDFYFRNA